MISPARKSNGGPKMTLVTKQDAAALSTEEKKRLGEIETRIRKGMANFLEVGRDLMIIRDEKLYREEFTSFEEYCRSRFEIDRTYAHRLIHSAEVMSSLSGGNNVAHGQHSETHGVDNSALPENERQVRELTKAPEPHRQKIWDEAVRTAPDGKVTAKHIRKTVRANFKPANQLGPRQT